MVSTDSNAELNAALGIHLNWWFREQSKDPCVAFYLFYQEGRYIELTVAGEAPGPEWKPVSNERISPSWTIEQARGRLMPHLRRAPVLVQEGD